MHALSTTCLLLPSIYLVAHSLSSNMAAGIFQPVHWFSDLGIGDYDSSRKRRRQCEGCKEMVREERMAYHGLPRTNTVVQLDPLQVDALLEHAMTLKCYCFGSPLHSRSLVVKDLAAHYGSEARVASAMATVETRLRVASDVIALRMERKISIRMSAFRETDRFTLNQHAALEHHHLQVFQHAGVARLVLFRCLLINCYFSRCCLSEASRKALHEHRFPFWNQTVASMSEELLVDAVAKKLRTLLEETRFSPYARVLNPYCKWIDSGTMFLDRRDGLSPCQDMLILILTVLTWDEECFLSPRLLEKHLADIKYFGTFRSKEVWLDFAYMLLEHPSWYDLSLADCGRIQAEAGNWVWGDWDDRASKGIREIYASMYIFSAYLLIRLMFLLCLPPAQPPCKGGGLRPPSQRVAAGRLRRTPPLWIPFYGCWGWWQA